jgi:iron complex outermembrane receptor protein
MTLLKALALFVPANFCAAVILGQSPASTVSGVVTDTTGRPLANALVTIRGGMTYTAVTNAAGSYVFKYLPEGQYTVQVHMIGFAVAERDSVLTVNGKTAVANFKLRPWVQSGCDIVPNCGPSPATPPETSMIGHAA